MDDLGHPMSLLLAVTPLFSAFTIAHAQNCVPDAPDAPTARSWGQNITK
jgi:hypothetical protein